MARARQLDPLSLAILSDTCKIYHLARRYPEAVRWCEKAIEMDPAFRRAHAELAGVYMSAGNAAAAMRETQEMMKSGEQPFDRLSLVGTRAMTGDAAARQELAHELETSAAAPFLTRAGGYIFLENYPRALDVLQRMVEQRDLGVVALKTHPMFDPLRSDPRFQSLLRRTGLQTASDGRWRFP